MNKLQKQVKGKVWGVCPHCGWTLTVSGVKENDGVPYCCWEFERAWLE